MEGIFVGQLNAQRLYETMARIMGEGYNRGRDTFPGPCYTRPFRSGRVEPCP